MNPSLHPKMTYFVIKECTPHWKLNDVELPFHALVFILEGSADYTINGSHYHAGKGDVVYIERKSDRLATTKGMKCVAFDFHLDEGETIDLPRISAWSNLEEFQWLFQEINFEWLQRRAGYQLKCQAIFALILHKLLFERLPRTNNAYVETIKRYIVEHFNEKLTVAALAKIANLNPVYCGVLFKQLEGRTISSFIHQVRINKAASLLETGEYNVSEVAEKTGYNDIYYFSSTFKRLMGQSPNAYKTNGQAPRRLL